MQVYCHLGIFGSKSIMVNEPPCAEPHAGWCGGWRLDTSGYPIYMRTGAMTSPDNSTANQVPEPNIELPFMIGLYSTK